MTSMFESAELGLTVSKETYAECMPVLREQLVLAQHRLAQADCPVIVVFGGVDGAGKGESANLVSQWLDPRRVITTAFREPTEEEAERPLFWRYWRALPPKGFVGVFLSAWYSKPFLARAKGEITVEQYEEELQRIRAFERTLADDGALILKFWMHLGKAQQKARFKALEKDADRSWRVTETDWAHWEKYDEFIAAAERLIVRTSTGEAPWMIIEGADARFRSLEVGRHLVEGIDRHLNEREAVAAVQDPALNPNGQGTSLEMPDTRTPVTVLSRLDLTTSIPKKVYSPRLKKLRSRLNKRYREARDLGITTVLVFEGWDAGGKGSAIRRLTRSMDARDLDVVATAAPTDEERAQHYLWRFWRQLPRRGRMAIFDRSWYGRVLVERIEGFASDKEWRRAYAEINDFEQQLVEHGIVLVKFWMHITKDEQEARFRAREQIPYKRWKITDEDWRNRARWDEYEVAAAEMIERTSTGWAPWVLVEGNDKYYARTKVLETVCDSLEHAIQQQRPEQQPVKDK